MTPHPLDDIAAYATDALDAGERREVERHLAGCGRCCRELAAHHETLALLVTPRPAPVHVWDRIRAATARRRPHRVRLVLAAAAVVVAAVALRGPDAATRRAILLDPDGRAAATVVSTGGTGYVLLDGLDPVPDDRSYQLWRLDGTEPVPLGVLVDDVAVLALPAGASRLAITLEPRRGSAAPTGPIVARGAFG